MDEDPLLTRTEVAELLGIRPSAVTDHLVRSRKHRAEGDPHRGDMPEPDKIAGRSSLWRRSTIDAWLSSRPSATWNRTGA